MAIPKRITNKAFAAKVLDFMLDELCNLREKFEHGDEQLINRPDEKKYSPFYQCIGKASTLFAVMYRDKVKLTLLRNRRRFSQSALVMDDFVNNFSNSFFLRVENCPRPWFPVIVLMYCGVFGAIADVCRNVHRPDLIDVCRLNFEMDMRTLVEDIQGTCGWRSFFNTACVYAGLYDTKFWNDDSDEEQAAGPSQVSPDLLKEEPIRVEYSEEVDQVISELLQEHAEDEAQEAEGQAQEQAQEHAAEAQEQAQEQAQEHAAEAQEQDQEQAQEHAGEAQEQAHEQVQEPVQKVYF